MKGMVRNRRLSRRVSDAAFGELRRQLTYKTQRHGGRLIVADRWMPSSKTCSRCGVVKAKLPLGVRVFECDACGLVLDRDANAGHNLAALAAANGKTGTGVTGDPGPLVVVPKPRGAKQKTRTARTRKGTGTCGSWRNTPPGDGNERSSTGHRARATRALVTPSRTFRAETPGILRVAKTRSNGCKGARGYGSYGAGGAQRLGQPMSSSDGASGAGGAGWPVSAAGEGPLPCPAVAVHAARGGAHTDGLIVDSRALTCTRTPRPAGCSRPGPAERAPPRWRNAGGVHERRVRGA